METHDNQTQVTQDTREAVRKEANNQDLQDKIIGFLKGMGNTDVAGSIALIFKDEDTDTINNTIKRIDKVVNGTNLRALVSSFNTASIKEEFKNDHEPQEVQLALAALKERNKILQLGRGRGRGLVLFEQSEIETPEQTPEPAVAQRADEPQDQPIAHRVDEQLLQAIEDTEADLEDEASSEQIQEPVAEETAEETEEETEDELEVLENALDTIYKLFQRKRAEERETEKTIQNLEKEVERLEKQVSKLEEEQSSIELTTWR